MKKVINLVLIIVVCFLIIGCKEKKIVTICSNSSKQSNYDISTKYTINSRKDLVESVVINQTIVSKDKRVLKDFEKQLKNQYKSNNLLYGGYTYDIKLDGKKLTSNVAIDYVKMDMKKFVKDNSAMKDYISKDNKFTLDGAKKLYKSTGAKCE